MKLAELGTEARLMRTQASVHTQTLDMYNVVLTAHSSANGQWMEDSKISFKMRCPLPFALKVPIRAHCVIFEGLKPSVRHWVMYYYIHVLLLCCVAEMWQQQKTTSSHPSSLQCRGLACLSWPHHLQIV